MPARLNIAFFGSSPVSAYSNEAATCYRGTLRALADRGHRITFFEPDARRQQQNREIPDPGWARVIAYSAHGTDGVFRALERAGGADLVVKASGVGVFDELLEREVLTLQRPETLVAFWDVDAPATLDRVRDNPDDPFLPLIPRYDLVFTCGGGPPVVGAYLALGASDCVPIYHALDPRTHHPVAPDPRFRCTLALLADRLPDREARIHEFFFEPARRLPREKFLLGGSGWERNAPALPNVRYRGHVSTHEHNAFHGTPRAVLNVSRESMAHYGYSPATRVFEAAGAGACLISDACEGIEPFLEPDREVLVAEDAEEVVAHLQMLNDAEANFIGRAALRRVLAEHTCAHRARELEAVLLGTELPIAN